MVNYLYAENNLIFLKLDSRAAIGTLRLGVILMVVAGSLLSMPLVWQLADIIMALMAITNLTAILLLARGDPDCQRLSASAQTRRSAGL